MDISKNNLLIIKDDSKRSRKSTAVKLPPEINESMIPKYVVYYKECYNKEKMLFREFFKIEKHPSVKTNRIYTSSKSNKISILDKLEQIKTILLNIENVNNQEETIIDEPIIDVEKITLPKYISLKKTEKTEKTETKYFFIYDKKIGTIRHNSKMLCDNNKSISENLKIFIEKINEKYN